MSPDATSNPIGRFTFRQIDNGPIKQPSPEVADKQDPHHTEAGFLRDLDKVSQKRS